MYQILIVIDDFANNPDFIRKSQLLHQLYIRGRHYMISTITATQVWKQISPIVRKNITHLFIYRLRNYAGLEGIIEELSAVYDKKTLLQIYHEAVSEDYNFLYVNLMQRDKHKMFLQRFDRYLVPSLKNTFILLYILTTLTNSEGKVLTYTNEVVEIFVLQLNPNNNYYTTGDDDILFIKTGSNKILTLYYTYHININIFQNYIINENLLNPCGLAFILNNTSNEYTTQGVYTASSHTGIINTLRNVYLAMYDTAISPYTYTGSENINITNNEISLTFP